MAVMRPGAPSPSADPPSRGPHRAECARWGGGVRRARPSADQRNSDRIPAPYTRTLRADPDHRSRTGTARTHWRATRIEGSRGIRSRRTGAAPRFHARSPPGSETSQSAPARSGGAGLRLDTAAGGTSTALPRAPVVRATYQAKTAGITRDTTASPREPGGFCVSGRRREWQFLHTTERRGTSSPE